MYISVGIKIGLSVYVPIFVNYCKFIYIFLICIFGWMVFCCDFEYALALAGQESYHSSLMMLMLFFFVKLGGLCIALHCVAC